ncbi:MAG: sigma-70 family RNA polymerase sigma factor [Thiobacillus sp.]
MSPGTRPLAQAMVESRRALLAYLRRQVGDAALAEDLLQDVFVKALTAKPAPDNPDGWLRTVARNTVADYFRRLRATEPLSDDAPSPPPADTLAHEGLATCLRPLAATLPPRYRDTLLALEFGDRTVRDLAEAESVSLSAIKSRAARARRMLRERVLDCCRVDFAAGLVDDYALRPGASCRPASHGRPEDKPG